MSSLIGQTLDHYRIDREIGQGGMGLIYQATDLQLQRPVAIKVMHSNLATHQQFRQRFTQEARAASSLENHPHIVRVLDFNPTHLYIVMELITGGSLRDYLNRMAPMAVLVSFTESLELVGQIADALDYAHQHGMTHRDVKPENILLKPNASPQGRLPYQAMLTDFGLAKLSESVAFSLTGAKPMGTFPYMAPEFFQALPVDGRADIYALGVVLYEMTVGRLPFKPQNVMEAYRMHTSESAPPPSTFRPEYPKALSQVVMKCLAKRPDDRYDTAKKLVNVLRRLQLDLNTDSVTETHMDTLKTQAGSMPKPRPLSRSPLLPAAPDEDSIVLQAEGQSARIIPISKQIMVIGRDPGSDIVLPDPFISRSHAILERSADGAYWIKDLRSTNHSVLGETPLRADIPETWTFGQTLQIGAYVLRLEPGSKRKTFELALPNNIVLIPATDHEEENLATDAVKDNKPPPRVLRKNAEMDIQPIRISMSPIHARVTPAESVEVKVTIANYGPTPDKVTVDVRGVPGSWAVVSPSEILLEPNQHASATVHFTPPDHWSSSAGRHTYTLRVHSSNQQMEVELITGVLHIADLYRLSTELHPKRVYGSGITSLALTNLGNAPVNLTIQVTEPENELQIDPSKLQASITPGQTETLQIMVQPLPDTLVHGGKLFTYDIRIQAEHGDFTALKGELLALADFIGHKAGLTSDFVPSEPFESLPPLVRVSSLNSISQERKGCFTAWLVGYTAVGWLMFVILLSASLLLRRPENALSQYAGVFMLSLPVLWMFIAGYALLLVQAWRRRRWAAYGLVYVSLVAIPLGTFAALIGWLLIRNHRRMFS